MTCPSGSSDAVNDVKSDYFHQSDTIQRQKSISDAPLDTEAGASPVQKSGLLKSFVCCSPWAIMHKGVNFQLNFSLTGLNYSFVTIPCHLCSYM